MRRLGVHTHRDVSMIADVALIASIFNIRLEDAKIEVGILFELTNFPRAGRVNSTLAECEESLRIRIFLRFVALRQVRSPISEILPCLDIGFVRKLGGALDQGLAAFLTFPVIGTNVLEAHGRGFPLVCGTHYKRSLALILEGLQYIHELLTSGGFLQAVLIKDIFVVEEAVDHGSHRHTEYILIIICNPGTL